MLILTSWNSDYSGLGVDWPGNNIKLHQEKLNHNIELTMLVQKKGNVLVWSNVNINMAMHLTAG